MTDHHDDTEIQSAELAAAGPLNLQGYAQFAAWVESKAAPQVLKVADDEYVEKSLHLPPPEPGASPLEVHTLTAIGDYLQANLDGLDQSAVAVHVLDPQTVNVLGPLTGRHKTRDLYLYTSCPKGVSLASFHPIEELRIALMTRFVQTSELAALLDSLARVTDKSEVVLEDDGVKQRVSMAQGIDLLKSKGLSPFVNLRPYRTFREVEQPKSLFLLRLRTKGSGGVEAALFGADGDAWQFEAIELITQHLTDMLPDGVTVLS
jgi:hypothetical protein